MGSTKAHCSVCHTNTTVHAHLLQEGILFALTVLVQDPLTPFPGSTASGKIYKLS